MNDIVGRWGGEEFVIVAPQTDLAGAAALGERSRAAIANEKINPGTHGISVTVSVGCAAGVEPAESLVATADKALYQSKADGRNRVTIG